MDILTSGSIIRFILSGALPICASSILAQDTVAVRADNPPVWGDSIELVEEMRIGTLDGADEYIFGAVSALAPGPTGNVPGLCDIALQHDSCRRSR